MPYGLTRGEATRETLLSTFPEDATEQEKNDHIDSFKKQVVNYNSVLEKACADIAGCHIVDYFAFMEDAEKAPEAFGFVGRQGE